LLEAVEKNLSSEGGKKGKGKHASRSIAYFEEYNLKTEQKLKTKKVEENREITGI